MKASARWAVPGLFLALLTFTVLSAQFSLADDSPDKTQTESLKQLSLEQLGNIQVTTASKEPQAVWKTAAAIYVITHEAIQRSGATSIPAALRLAPGVEVARISSSQWSIGIRGFGSRLCRSVLVLIDGRTVYTTLLAGTYWEVQDTVMDDIDRIEVIRGPGGTIWGPNAVNGVINIITRTAADTHGTLVSAGGGSVEQGFITARGGGNAGKLNYRIYGKAFTRGPQFHSDGQNFDDWRSVQGGFRMDWTQGTRDSFTLQGDIYDQHSGESVVGTSYTPPYSQVFDQNALLSGGNILGRWKRSLGEGEDLQVQVYYDKANRHEANFADLRDTVDIDLLNRLRFPGRQEVTWGLGARFSRGVDHQVVSGLTFQPSERTDRLLSAFVQDEISLIPDRVTLSLGTKFLGTNFSGLQLEPSARLLYTPSTTQTLWAAFTHAVRTPSDAERDFFLSGFIGIDPNDGLPAFARFNANRNFRSEQLNGYELGYRRLVTSRLYVDIAAFYNHYSNLFSEDIIGPEFIEDDPPPTHHLLPAQFGNGLFGSTTGVEIAPEWSVTPFWRLRGSYSFLEMHIKKTPTSLDIGSAPSIVGSSPQHEVSLQSGFDISKSLTLDVLYRYVSALPAQKVRAYSSGDVSFGWQMSRQFRFSVVGQDLLQPHHPEFGTDAHLPVEIRRSVYAEVTFQK